MHTKKRGGRWAFCESSVRYTEQKTKRHPLHKQNIFYPPCRIYFSIFRSFLMRGERVESRCFTATSERYIFHRHRQLDKSIFPGYTFLSQDRRRLGKTRAFLLHKIRADRSTCFARPAIPSAVTKTAQSPWVAVMA